MTRWGLVGGLLSLTLAACLLVAPVAAYGAPLHPVAKKKPKKKKPAAVKCRKGQAKVTVRRKGRKARKTCLTLKRSGKPVDDLMRRAAERGVPRRYRRLLRSRGARRVAAGRRLASAARSASLRGGARPRAAGRRRARVSGPPETINTTKVLKDDGRTKVTRREDGVGQVTDDGVENIDKRVTTETADRSGVRSTETERVVKKAPLCPDGNGQIKGSLRHVKQKVDAYPTADGGRAVVSSKAELTIDWMVQVDDNAEMSSFDATDRLEVKNDVRVTPKGEPPRTLSSGRGSARSATSADSTKGIAEPGFGSAPTMSAAGTLGANDIGLQYLAMRMFDYSLVRDEVSYRGLNWKSGGCVALEVAPKNLTIEEGASATARVTLKLRGAPFDGRVDVSADAGLRVAPSPARGPESTITIASGPSTGLVRSVSLRHRSKRGASSASINVLTKKRPPPPPPADGPRYTGSISGSTLDANTGLSLTWTGTLGLGFRARHPTGQFGAPPGDYWYYANDAGSVNVTLHKPASDANDCEWNGSATLSISDPGGPSSSVQADDGTPAYFLFVQPAPGQQIPFTKTGPQPCAGTGNLPIYGYVAWARTPTAQQSSSTTLGSSATMTEGPKTENWSWSLSR
ncbi:MAG TPA: hypothetical protein VEX39_18820 [Thermoleophilaceae bacterium]|nr:hypothetical protein [Thermoleophilaceae bacterium]